MIDYGFYEDIKEIRDTIMRHRENMTDEQKERVGPL